jgi:hypothetical protein
MYLIRLIFLFFFSLSTLIIYHWHQNKNLWKNSLVKKNLIEWSNNSIVVLIKHHNKYIIKVFEINYKKFINLEDFNLEIVFLDKKNIIDSIKKLQKKNPVIYIILTKIPLNTILEYIKQENIEIKNPFIILNQSEEKVIIHNYFFNKSKEVNDFFILNVYNVDQINNKIFEIENNFNNLFFFSVNDINNTNNILDNYEKSSP